MLPTSVVCSSGLSIPQLLFDRPLDQVDGPGDRDLFGADAGALEVVHAPPSPVGRVHLFEPFQGLIIPRFELAL